MSNSTNGTNCGGDQSFGDATKAKNNTLLTQLVLSASIGIISFLVFCALRTRWSSLFAARKRLIDSAAALPELPDSFFGWMPVLYRVTERQVLNSAGIDAYVFLAFFKMAIRFLAVTFVLAGVVIAPINYVFITKPAVAKADGKTGEDADTENKSYLWTYTLFTYLFTSLAFYFIIAETSRVIRVRQTHLGSQETITDRTMRLSGIPKDLRSEEKIKEIIEKLEIGKVENVTLCCDWSLIDNLMDRRARTLRKLEESWTVYLGQQKKEEVLPVTETPSTTVPEDAADVRPQEGDELLPPAGDHPPSTDKLRPTTRIAYGIFNFCSRKVDAIDYYEEHLRRLDEKIQNARKKEYTPAAMAFVTMDSIAACQMAVQAVIDPSPMLLLATLAPAPADILWTNTYISRRRRMLASWTITLFVLILSIIWLIPIAALAALLNPCNIEKVSTKFGRYLLEHSTVGSLVTTAIPTIVVSLLNVAVPLLYDNLSSMQGYISQSEVELSLISKNFFFTFFNIFLVFTVFGTVSNIFPVLEDSLKDTTKLAHQLAQSLQNLAAFYTNFILLQGVALFPLRLLEFGSIALYPIMRMGAKTPRDFAELVQPPVLKYGYYLPTAILVFILCLVYSVLPSGYLVLLFGLIYFILGYWVYKYQLLYAMDHPQHGTGQAWSMICQRVIMGIGIFQLAMFGFISLKGKVFDALTVLPLIVLTMMFSGYYSRTYEPLTKYIALRSIFREDSPDSSIADAPDGGDLGPGLSRTDSTTMDEIRERGQKFINPSLVTPLQKVWIGMNPGQTQAEPEPEPEPEPQTNGASASSSLSLGDTHIWRDSGRE